jgi:hypothetical protein
VATNGKVKGGEFERSVAKALSRWVSNGVSEDLYWRSSMSGGRATISKGKVRQAGDITAVAPEGHVLTDKVYIECKFYKKLSIDCFIKGKGTLIDFWVVAVREAAKYGKIPVLIFKQNNWPVMFCTSEAGVDFLFGGTWGNMISISYHPLDMHLIKFDCLLKLPFPLK